MLYLVFLFVIGAAVGSFLNVCIHRLPRSESVIFPASHCPHCGHKLGVFDLIPILSYLVLQGKCRYCRASFSFRYPLVEFLSGVSLVWVVAVFSPLEAIFALIFVALMILIFFTDLEQQVIPDALSVSGILLGLLYNGIKGNLISALLGMFMGFSLLYLIGFVGKLVFKKQAMGEGDFFLGALLGACLGWQGILLTLFLAYLLAAVVSLVLLAAGKVKMGEYVPFGPALAVAGVIALFFGEMIVKWYLGLLF